MPSDGALQEKLNKAIRIAVEKDLIGLHISKNLSPFGEGNIKGKSAYTGLKQTINNKQPSPTFSVFTSMQRNFARNLYANSFQLFMNHGLNLVVFLVLAKTLEKTEFGLLNWMLATLLTVFSIGSFGLDQLMVKKVADGEKTEVILSSVLMHNILTGSIMILFLFILSFFFKGFPFSSFLLLSIGKFAFSLSIPYKQVMAGREAFHSVARMSIGSNIVKACGIAILFLFFSPEFFYIALLFMLADLAELCVSLVIYHRGGSKKYEFFQIKSTYKKLVKESFPQFGTVILAAAMARFDWILIGILLSQSSLAEYSFAYRVFEIALLPMLVIAPLLIPKFTKHHKGNSLIDKNFLFRMEMLLASFILLMLNIFWQPFADWVSDGNYGLVNIQTIFILSLTMPLLYYNNFLWSGHFAAGKLKMIFRIFLLCFLANAALNMLLLPIAGIEGSALAYLIAILIQTILYHRREPAVNSAYWQTMILICLPAIAGIIIFNLARNNYGSILGIVCYFTMLLTTKQLKVSDRKKLWILLRS